MKRKDAIRMAMYERIEAYLRFRCAWLGDDKSWLNRPACGPLPAAVERTLESVCFDCLNAAVTNGDWSVIDGILQGEESAPPDGRCFH